MNVSVVGNCERPCINVPPISTNAAIANIYPCIVAEFNVARFSYRKKMLTLTRLNAAITD
jgi:hypothetical protein